MRRNGRLDAARSTSERVAGGSVYASEPETKDVDENGGDDERVRASDGDDVVQVKHNDERPSRPNSTWPTAARRPVLLSGPAAASTVSFIYSSLFEASYTSFDTLDSEAMLLPNKTHAGRVVLLGMRHWPSVLKAKADSALRSRTSSASSVSLSGIRASWI